MLLGPAPSPLVNLLIQAPFSPIIAMDEQKIYENGTDMVLKDAKSRKIILVANGPRNRIDSSLTRQVNGECTFNEKREIKDAWKHEMWNDTSKTVKVKAKNSMGNLALRFGCAFFWSFYVCFMLVGLLVSGFLFEGFMMRCLLEKPIQITETLNFDNTKSSPIAFVPIMSSPVVGDPSSLISKDDIKSAKEIGPRVIPYNHRLQLTVSLTVFESEYNRKLGVFQVRVEFLSSSGKVTASSSYPCMLQIKSQTVRFAETIIKSIPVVTGHQSESQVLNIKMNEFTEGLVPTACLKVILEQRAEFQPGAVILKFMLNL
ncbi:hypothetical protein CRYUN_Cryun26dG0108100 [Craigia yunnanensis]